METFIHIHLSELEERSTQTRPLSISDELKTEASKPLEAATILHCMGQSVTQIVAPWQDWFGQGIADLPSDPVWGAPFMAGVLLFACSFLACFFERERRLGRLGSVLR